jgi:hypothetical protein
MKFIIRIHGTEFYVYGSERKLIARCPDRESVTQILRGLQSLGATVVIDIPDHNFEIDGEKTIGAL